MRHLPGVIALFILLFPTLVHGECAEGVSNGHDSFRFALRSLREPTFAKAREYMAKSRDAAEKALAAAEECECEEAANEFHKARRLAREAVKGIDFDPLRKAAFEVMEAAKTGTDEAERCR